MNCKKCGGASERVRCALCHSLLGAENEKTRMIATISVEFLFESAHRLPLAGKQHKCSRLHGHSYRVVVELTGEVGEKGWVHDFSLIEENWDVLAQKFDHVILNDVPGLENPTAENIARYIYKQMRLPWSRHGLVREQIDISKVTVWENPRYSASYSE